MKGRVGEIKRSVMEDGWGRECRKWNELRRFLYFKLKLRIKGIRLSRVLVKGFLAVPGGRAVIFFLNGYI